MGIAVITVLQSQNKQSFTKKHNSIYQNRKKHSLLCVSDVRTNNFTLGMVVYRVQKSKVMLELISEIVRFRIVQKFFRISMNPHID